MWHTGQRRLTGSLTGGHARGVTPPDSSTHQLPVHADVARDLAAAALLRGDFVLRSGQRSSFYFDKYLFETNPGLLRRIARLLAPMVPAGIDRLAGPELGAVALAAALSLETDIPFIIVRKGSKEYGASAGKPLEGTFQPGERVVVVEDVLTTGGEALRSAAVLTELGLVVDRILVVVDRGQGGREAIATAGYNVQPLFGPSDLGIE